MSLADPSPVAAALNCTQCGGELHPDEGQVFLTCPYCAATVFVDRARVVFHWSIAPTLNEQQAGAALFRWMSGSQTVKDLDKKARVVGQSFQYFPVWLFRWQKGQHEELVVQPAAATSVTELANLKIPAGDLLKYDPALDAQSAPPSVPLETGLEWAKQRSQPQQHSLPKPERATIPDPSLPVVRETSLVHIPLYFYKYEFRGQVYTAIVDGASGSVLANLFPAKQETPYRLVGIVTALVYLCLALVPLVAWGAGDDSGAAIGLGICVGAGLLAALPLFAWAFWVANKV